MVLFVCSSCHSTHSSGRNTLCTPVVTSVDKLLAQLFRGRVSAAGECSLSYSTFLLFEAAASKLAVNTVCKQEEAAHRCLFTLLVLFFLCTKCRSVSSMLSV